MGGVGHICISKSQFRRNSPTAVWAAAAGLAAGWGVINLSTA